MSVFAEMRGWSSSANFARRNGFNNRHSALYGMWNDPMGFSINLGESSHYFRQFGGRPSDADLFGAIKLFGSHR